MKTISKLIYLLLVLIFWGCGNSTDENIAFGHFEAEERLISAETMGKIMSLHVEDGQKVKKGDPIALIDTTQIHLNIQQLNATMDAVRLKTQSVDEEIEVLQQKKSYLEGEVERFKKLVADSAATPKQLNDLQSEVQVIEKQIAATKAKEVSTNQSILSEIRPLQAKLEILEDQLEKSKITAPVDGTVISVITYEGEFAAPGKPIVKMAMMEDMNIRVYLTGDQLSQVNISDQLVVRATGIEGEFKGTVQWISEEAEFTPKNIQTADEKSNLVYAVKLGIANDGRLKRGMPGEVQLNSVGNQ